MTEQHRRRRLTRNETGTRREFPSSDPDRGQATAADDLEIPAEPGTEITVTWGEETFSPVQYNSFRIGGHSIKVTVQPGETALDAFKRGWGILEQAAQVMFDDKLNGFRDRLNQTKR